jgi:hypothetical protein
MADEPRFWCRLCSTDVDLDDVWFRLRSGKVICVRCYERETGSGKRMDAEERRQVREALADAGGTIPGSTLP